MSILEFIRVLFRMCVCTVSTAGHILRPRAVHTYDTSDVAPGDSYCSLYDPPAALGEQSYLCNVYRLAAAPAAAHFTARWAYGSPRGSGASMWDPHRWCIPRCGAGLCSSAVERTAWCACGLATFPLSFRGVIQGRWYSPLPRYVAANGDPSSSVPSPACGSGALLGAVWSSRARFLPSLPRSVCWARVQ
jgi:hypothetical protein